MHLEQKWTLNHASISFTQTSWKYMELINPDLEMVAENKMFPMTISNEPQAAYEFKRHISFKFRTVSYSIATLVGI